MNTEDVPMHWMQIIRPVPRRLNSDGKIEDVKANTGYSDGDKYTSDCDKEVCDILNKDMEKAKVSEYHTSRGCTSVAHTDDVFFCNDDAYNTACDEEVSMILELQVKNALFEVIDEKEEEFNNVVYVTAEKKPTKQGKKKQKKSKKGLKEEVAVQADSTPKGNEKKQKSKKALKEDVTDSTQQGNKKKCKKALNSTVDAVAVQADTTSKGNRNKSTNALKEEVADSTSQGKNKGLISRIGHLLRRSFICCGGSTVDK